MCALRHQLEELRDVDKQVLIVKSFVLGWKEQVNVCVRVDLVGRIDLLQTRIELTEIDLYDGGGLPQTYILLADLPACSTQSKRSGVNVRYFVRDTRPIYHIANGRVPNALEIDLVANF